MIRYFLAVIAFLFINESMACMEPNTPDLANLEKYPSIYVGEVTSVNLESRERGLLLKETGSLADFHGKENTFYSLRAVVSETIRGEGENILTTKFSHCGTLVPQLKDTGIFFVTENKEVLPIYSSNGPLFLKASREIEALKH